MRPIAFAAAACLASAALAGLLVPSTCGQIFRGASVPVGSQPSSVSVADVDGDGIPDLLASSAAILRISVSRGLGGGSFAPAQTFFVSSSQSDLAVGDFNADGKLDVVTSNPLGNGVSRLLGDGAGGFGPPSSWFVGTQPHAIAVGDFNLDGLPDVATAGSNGGVSVLIATPGGFAPAVSFALLGLQPFDVGIADLNGDGFPDFATANRAGGSIARFLGNGAGGFGPVAFFPSGSGTSALAFADLDGDGKLDVAVANDSGHNVARLFGDGAGGFGAPTSFPSGTSPQAVKIADWTGDGKLDLVVAEEFDDGVLVLAGDGTGGFGGFQSTKVLYRENDVVVADVSGDGKLDLVAVGVLDAVEVLFGDGAGQILGLDVYTSVADSIGIVAGDFNHDGAADVCAVAGPTGQKIAILLGDGAGGFGAPASFAENLGGDRPMVADFNLDGDLDVITLVATQNPAGKVSVHYGDGAGGLLNPFYVSAPNVSDAALGDLNRDGILDVVYVQYQASGLLTARLGSATTGLGAPQSVSTSPFPLTVAVGDITSDGFPDAAYAAQGPVLGWSANFGNGTLGPVTQSPTGATGALDLALADLDRDGRPDLLAITFGSLLVRLGTGPATFGSQVAYPTNGESVGLLVGDVDGDGNLDAVVGLDAVAWLRGDGAGALSAPVSYVPGVGAGYNSRVLADIDADGRPDVVSIAYAFARVTVLRNQLPSAAGVSSFGAGTPGCAGTLGIGTTVAPKVGEANFAFTCTQAPPNAIGLGLVGDVGSVGGVDPLGLGALFHVDLLGSSFLQGLNFTSDAGGTALAPAPIPNDPGLAGAALVAQGVWIETPPFSCTMSPFHLVSTSGLALMLLP